MKQTIKTTGQGVDHLYRSLRAVLCQDIFYGRIGLNERLPAERKLADQFRVSRVTIRKTLGLLEAEGLLIRHQGQGAFFRGHGAGYQTSMDIIALCAPTHNPFFTDFITHFETIAEENGSLVVFKQTPNKIKGGFRDTLYKLYEKNIRNIVIWPYDQSIELKYLQRLRALGTNLVLFDQPRDTPYADSVSVDNAHAISTLHDHCRVLGKRSIIYVGWDTDIIASNIERRQAAAHLLPHNHLLTLPWRGEMDTRNDIPKLLKRIGDLNIYPDAFICGNGNIAFALAETIYKGSPKQGGQRPLIFTIDDLPGIAELDLIVYPQPMDILARTVFDCLNRQNFEADSWKAAVHYVKSCLKINMTDEKQEVSSL